jgi:hypothetical protein
MKTTAWWTTEDELFCAERIKKRVDLFVKTNVQDTIKLYIYIAWCQCASCVIYRH